MRYFVQVDYGIHNTHMKETVHVAKVLKHNRNTHKASFIFPMAEATGKLSSHLQDDLLQINDVWVGVESAESLDLPQVVHLLNATCGEQTQSRHKVDTRLRWWGIRGL